MDRKRSSYQAISVYYRDLNNGPWFGINQEARFAPVSLLKVPLMIGYLKYAENNPQLLNQKIKYQQSQLNQNIPLINRLTPNQNYSIEELISRMITYSDNGAFELLLNNLSSQELKKIHRELDIIYPNQSTPDDYITVKSYAGLFRVLYNATYLSRSMSEKGLSYLLHSDFNLGIRAGLPDSVPSALKFGIKNDPQKTALLQIHDCGIIYAPDKPYLLCIMTKGNNRDQLIALIRTVSQIIYQGISHN